MIGTLFYIGVFIYSHVHQEQINELHVYSCVCLFKFLAPLLGASGSVKHEAWHSEPRCLHLFSHCQSCVCVCVLSY